MIIFPAAGVFERGCGVDGPAGRAGARAGRRSGAAISLCRPRAVVSGCPLRPAVRELVLATKAGGATIATSDAPVVSASPLRPASPSVTRNRLGSRPPALLSGRYLRQPRTFVSDPVLRSGRLCKHAQPNPPSAHARSSPDSGWPVCYPVRSPTSPTHEAEVTLATAALFADLPCALQSLVFLSNLSLGCIVLVVVY